MYIDFTNKEVTPDFKPEILDIDYIIMSLFLHIPSWYKAIGILQRCYEISKHIVVAAFSQPITKWNNHLLHFDQYFTSHYKNFTIYADKGYFLSLTDESNIVISEELPTFDPAITIYIIKTNVGIKSGNLIEQK